jgi:hypothetical protein
MDWWIDGLMEWWCADWINGLVDWSSELYRLLTELTGFGHAQIEFLGFD